MTARKTNDTTLLTRFHQDESGVGSVLSVFLIIMVLIIGGVAVDTSNVWRHHQLLQQTSDVAAHSGAVELAKGNTTADAHAAAVSSVGFNMPKYYYGELFEDQSKDVQLLHYDPVTNKASTSGKVNAVAVTLRRSESTNNPVPTYLLRIADLMKPGPKTSLSEWNVEARGVAAFVKTRRCSSSDGLYAKGEVNLTSSSFFGAGYCLHGQSAVWMPQNNTFESGSGVSMQDLNDCKNKCVDDANDGASEAAFEQNLIMEDLGEHIDKIEAAFRGTGDTSIRDEFFNGKSLGYADLPELDAVGINTGTLKAGDTVEIDKADFEALEAVPSGLTYDVSCNGKNQPLKISDGTANLDSVAIITDCAIDFASDATVQSSMLLSDKISNSASITATQGASVGVANSMCDPDLQSTIMGKSDMDVPSDFAGSNVAFVVDGDIHLAAKSNSTTSSHNGVSFHSSGEIKIAANHEFHPCANPPSGLMPALKVIRHVFPLQDSFNTN
ncbi:hypothetical protein KPG71_02545 [Roseovarius sp. PS-C2]|uniref:TadE/TadG family type IV pilus assembly protein n=1 Tax=Roseovarius sp. PS-C2 TaxID=2820814 RepID=UPI001C0DDB72|nr:TadE/TadG family type IV pilus assembly protein [Roseovarius sp. PS-C2]MBU3258887.1 hypothetical protein [Roseovarius sp. PS-C2]